MWAAESSPVALQCRLSSSRCWYTVGGWELGASPVVGDVNASPLQRQAERHRRGPGDTARHHVHLSWLKNMAVLVFLI